MVRLVPRVPASQPVLSFGPASLGACARTNPCIHYMHYVLSRVIGRRAGARASSECACSVRIVGERGRARKHASTHTTHTLARAHAYTHTRDVCSINLNTLCASCVHARTHARYDNDHNLCIPILQSPSQRSGAPGTGMRVLFASARTRAPC